VRRFDERLREDKTLIRKLAMRTKKTAKTVTLAIARE
jgi:hypothetical protein